MPYEIRETKEAEYILFSKEYLRKKINNETVKSCFGLMEEKKE